MAQMPFAFNPQAVQPSEALDVMAAGWYPAKGIIESEVKATKTGGSLISVTIELQSGRKVWHNFNIVNDSQKAVEIAYADLAALCGAIGMQQAVSDTTQLHSRPFDVKLKVEQQEGYDPKNVVAGGGFAVLGSKQDKYVRAAEASRGAPFNPGGQQFAAPVAPAQFAPQAPAQGTQFAQPVFQPPAPIQQPMPQPPQPQFQVPFPGSQPQQPQPAPFPQPQQFAGGQPAQPQGFQPGATPAQSQQPSAVGFQPHPSAPQWTQPR